MEIKLYLPWPVSVNLYYRRAGYKVYLSPKGRAYKANVADYFKGRDVPIFPEERIYLDVKYHPPDRREKRDVDNFSKCWMDSLIGFLYTDDSQVKKLHQEMLTDTPKKGGQVEITALLYVREKDEDGKQEPSE
tara:strand:+ start:99 stop:497 length:399 start_codon:yes stop_codon:yes gene_type:complete